MSFKVKNSFKWNGTKLVWSSGEVSDKKYQPFLDASKTQTFEAGQGLIGNVWKSGAKKDVDVTTLDGKAYLRLDKAKACGLTNCTVTKDGDHVNEVFH